MNRKKLITQNIKEFTQKVYPAHLLAVSKYSSVEDISFAYGAGQRDFGESRVQDLKDKSEELFLAGCKSIRWHFIGHIQTNKLNRLLKIRGLRYIHSIDSMNLLESLYERIDHFEGEKLSFFLQVKTTDEEEKGGFSNYDEIGGAVNYIFNHENQRLNFHGLMTMGAIRTEDFEESARASFKNLVEIKRQLQKDFELKPLKLSMGMSSDYKLALEYGSDWVRIGSLLFGS